MWPEIQGWEQILVDHGGAVEATGDILSAWEVGFDRNIPRGLTSLSLCTSLSLFESSTVGHGPDGGPPLSPLDYL